MGLSSRVDPAPRASVVGTEGETAVHCRRYGLESVYFENELISRQDETCFHSFFVYLLRAR